ncbi:MAG: urease accessory protein UreE [Janthinobacterium lividum]
MIRATSVLPKGHWSDHQVTASVADTVVLDFDDRHRRRIAMTGTGGLEFLLDLDEAVALRGGDGLVLEDGRLVEVVAAPEPLIEVRGRTPGDLVRLAWHIGNRHLSAQVMANALRLRGDHVIEDMLRGLGASVVSIDAPFDPEGGAYAGAGHATVDHHKHGDGPKDEKKGKHKHDDGHKHGKHDHHDHAPAKAADGDAGKHKHDDHKHGHKHDHKHDH